jgi:hypothetical protein
LVAGLMPATVFTQGALSGAEAAEASKPAAHDAVKGTGQPADKAEWKNLFDGKTLTGWKAPQFGGEGKVYVKDGAIVIEHGDQMSGVTATGDLPKIDYELTLEGKKIDGNDFFCTTTFPVGNSHCSFVVGGWGGSVVGLSSIDGYDASDNQTNKIRDFKSNRWYRLRIRVTQGKIETWIDNEKLVDCVTKGHKIGIRWECDLCRPLGVSTWCTTGAIRDVRIRRLTPEEIRVAKEEAEKQAQADQ